MKRGNCYVASEALYHILGGKKSDWKPMRMQTKQDTHWFLKHNSGFILDISRLQFGKKLPDYNQAKGGGFLTKNPSRRAVDLINKLTWQEKIKR